ncbi:MAG: glucosaminidase domain-containing protein [Rhodospirillaceae bacterium]|nr:glucosaminidase domain-containing protein [Rhodospirillaceae bacterium]
MTFLKSVGLAIIGALHALYTQARLRPLEAQALLVVLILSVGALRTGDEQIDLGDGRIVITGDDLSVDTLEDIFSTYGYSLDRVRDEGIAVPRLIVSAMPDGLKEIRIVDQRKRLFFSSVLPLILTENEEIAKDRQRLLIIASKIGNDEDNELSLSADDIACIDILATRYGIDRVEEEVSLSELFDVLKVRVAPIPTSLALAQAVEESAWGTSRFARQGNALFGQWVWNEDAGIVPTEQREGQAYAVRAFETPLQSVKAYAKNLNTHWAYATFREQRAEMLGAEEELDGWALAETLTRYSERGEAYVESLQAIMRVNRLRPLDKASLATPSAMIELAAAE